MKDLNNDTETVPFQALKEIRELATNEVLQISKIEWWLLKYQSSYNVIGNDWKCKGHLSDVDDATCLCGVKPDGHVFVELFLVLTDICSMRRLESRFNQEIEHYNSVKNNHSALRDWEVNLENWGCDNTFLIHYKGINYFDDNPLLIVYQYQPFDIMIAIRKSELPHAITFHQIWEQVYWKNQAVN